MLAAAAPSPTITSVSDFASLALRNGGSTNAAPLTIAGTVVNGATAVTVFNGNTALGSATVAGKTWSFTTGVLPEGTYNFRARATVGTATSPASAQPFVVTVDTTAPAAPTISNISDDKAPVVGTVPRDGTTNDQTLTLTGTAEPGSRVEVFAGPTSLGIATLVGSTWRFTTKPLTADGNYSFTARATDKAGNTSVATIQPYSVTVDTETTTAIISIMDNVGTVSGDLLNDLKYLRGVTNDTTLELIGTAEPGSRVEVFAGSTSLGFATLVGSTWRLTTEPPTTEPPTTERPMTKPPTTNLLTSKPLMNGQTYRFTARATDRAGNTGVSDPVIPILIDTTPAWSAITDVNDGSKAVADRGVTNKTSLTISGRAEPRQKINVPGGGPIIVRGSTVEVFDRDTSTNPATDTLVGTVDEVDVDGTWSIDISGLAEGPHRFYVRATDAAGNASVLPSVNYTVTVDLTAPAAPTILSAIDSKGPNVGTVNSGGSTDDTRPLFTGTTPELGTVVTIYDGSDFLGLADVTGTTWTFRPPSPLKPNIVHTLNATATDRAGNESAAGSFTIDIDTTGAKFTGFGTQPTARTYEFGEVVFIELDFDEPVYVDTTDGTPRIQLNTVPPRYAVYDPVATGSMPTSTLVFRYDPQLGDKTPVLQNENGNKTEIPLDFVRPTPLDPPQIDANGGTIRDAVGNDVDLRLDSLAADRTITVDAQLRLTVLGLSFVSDAQSPPTETRHARYEPIANLRYDPSLPSLESSQITIKFNAPLTSGFTSRSFDLFLENRSMTTEGILIEDLGDCSYRLTLPPATHQSLWGYYRLVIGSIDDQDSGIESGGVPMDEVVALHWYMPPSA